MEERNTKSWVEIWFGEFARETLRGTSFPAEFKRKMTDLVNNLRQAFRNRIEAIDWMTEETKKEAYRKLSSFEPKIGYPENWEDLTAIEIDQAELFLNARRIQNFFQKKGYKEIRSKRPTELNGS